MTFEKAKGVPSSSESKPDSGEDDQEFMQSLAEVQDLTNLGAV